MKKYLLFLCLLATISVAFAQTQRGYVKTRGRLAANGSLIPGTRLAGATITFKDNVAVVSGPNGAFSYPMRSKTFSVESVKKKGYQLYDPDLLGRTHSYSSNDLLVVMDTPENVLEDRLAAVRKIRNTLQKQLNEKTNELAALKKQHKITEEEYQKKIQALQKAQDKNEELISEMAERYSTLDFEAMDDFRRRVAAYIQNGELTRADSLLNTKGSMEERCAELAREREALRKNAEDLRKRQEEQEKGEAHYAKILEDIAADCYNHFEICKLRHDNDSAAYWIELRACQDSTNVDWQLQAGRFIDDYIADYHKALRYYQRALHSAMVQEGEKCEHVATSYNNIGSVYSSQGDYPKALEMHQKALDIRLEVLGANHPDVATSYNNLGSVYHSQGNYPKALEMYQKALGIWLDVLGANHPSVATSYNNMGLVYKSQGNYSKALEMYQKALGIWLEVYGENHSEVATLYDYICSVYYSAKEQGVELPGFKDFTQSGLFACETVGDDTPAAKAGMSGTYYMLEFADWTLDSDASIFAKNNEMRGKPKNIVVMRGDKIARLHFEDRIGVQFVFKKVGEEERQRVLKAYRAWKESQGNRHE